MIPKKYVKYSGHEWRERLPLGKSGYICIECNATCAKASEMPMGNCRTRLAPAEWLPQTA